MSLPLCSPRVHKITHIPLAAACGCAVVFAQPWPALAKVFPIAWCHVGFNDPLEGALSSWRSAMAPVDCCTSASCCHNIALPTPAYQCFCWCRHAEHMCDVATWTCCGAVVHSSHYKSCVTGDGSASTATQTQSGKTNKKSGGVWRCRMWKFRKRQVTLGLLALARHNMRKTCMWISKGTLLAACPRHKLQNISFIKQGSKAKTLARLGIVALQELVGVCRQAS